MGDKLEGDIMVIGGKKGEFKKFSDSMGLGLARASIKTPYR